MKFTDGDVVGYLKQFGYLNGDASDAAVKSAVIDFQKGSGLTVDGEPGAKTRSVMTLPRCGCPDHLAQRSSSAKWHKPVVTWHIDGYVGDTLSRSQQEELVQQGCDAWSQYIPKTFRRAKNSERPDILITAKRGRSHGLDGPGRTLAYAYLPQGNDRQLSMVFDLDEHWLREKAGQGILFLNVFNHEFGHNLGLDHDADAKRKALMDPIYDPSVPNPLGPDVERIQSLYGKRKSVPESDGDEDWRWTNLLGWIHIPAREGDIFSVGNK